MCGGGCSLYAIRRRREEEICDPQGEKNVRVTPRALNHNVVWERQAAYAVAGLPNEMSGGKRKEERGGNPNIGFGNLTRGLSAPSFVNQQRRQPVRSDDNCDDTTSTSSESMLEAEENLNCVSRSFSEQAPVSLTLSSSSLSSGTTASAR